MSLRVVKVGGRPLGDAAWLEAFAAEVARSAGGLVVVHGGGPEVDTLSARLGIGVERNAGRRITPPEALDVASMVLTGRINKRVVSAFLSAGVDAVGLAGEDGALLEAEVVEGGMLGRVGEIMRVRSSLLEALLKLGLTPILSPISRGADGGALNVNADDVAMAVAAALGASELLFLTDVAAVRDERGERHFLEAGEAMVLLERGVIRDGMAVKVRAALRALAAGVGSVRIGGLEALTDSEAGTRIAQPVEVAA